ncbi:MAG: hypothetical protein JNM84_19745 [Planctomycetes bacterium]|nr:hypothetical protein [Planctomycetota bacterium]
MSLAANSSGLLRSAANNSASANGTTRTVAWRVITGGVELVSEKTIAPATKPATISPELETARDAERRWPSVALGSASAAASSWPQCMQTRYPSRLQYVGPPQPAIGHDVS